MTRAVTLLFKNGSRSYHDIVAQFASQKLRRGFRTHRSQIEKKRSLYLRGRIAKQELFKGCEVPLKITPFKTKQLIRFSPLGEKKKGRGLRLQVTTKAQMTESHRDQTFFAHQKCSEADFFAEHW